METQITDLQYDSSSGSGGRRGGHDPLPAPVKISHKKDDHKGRRILSFIDPPYPAAGSATG